MKISDDTPLNAQDLPQVIPVFPLNGALLLPHSSRPLNIFEPRYLNMIDDAMAAERIIGMVQIVSKDLRERPSLAPVGCAGKITTFSETADGRYLITLTGVVRFRLGDELPGYTPYRRARVDFSPFGADLTPLSRNDEDREALIEPLRHYLNQRGMRIDWAAVKSAPVEALVNSLAMALPFEAVELQALLEAPTLAERRRTLVALLRIDGAYGVDEPPPSVQ